MLLTGIYLIALSLVIVLIAGYFSEEETNDEGDKP
jgi:hypothetical protein